MEYNTPQVQEQEKEVDFVHILKLCYFTFISKWYWFLLSAIVGLALAYVYLQRQPRIYQRESMMLIEDSEGSGGSLRGTSRKRGGNMSALMELNGISVGDNLTNEMFILTSKRLLTRVVEDLGLDVDLTTKQGLHNVPLYGVEPLKVTFSEKAEQVGSCVLSITENGGVELKDFKVAGKEKDYTVKARPGATVRTPLGQLKIEKGPEFDKFQRDKEIYLSHVPVEMAAGYYKSRVSASEYDANSSLIRLVCNDGSPRRADNILNSVFDAYKFDVVDNKNRVARSTADFIESRLALIGSELSEVESKLASFKQRNNIVDFRESASAAVSQGITARSKSLEIETQLNVAKYLQDFLQKNSMGSQLIPDLNMAGSGISAQIAAYNTLMNERNKLVANSSESAPAVREADKNLADLRNAIRSSLSSYIHRIEIEAGNARANEAELNARVAAAPVQERLGLDIQRQQALKEALYTYLLNKREEVALQTAINEANVRIVEGPGGSGAPISPKTNIILLIGLAAGLAVPALILWIINMLDITISGRRDVENVTTIPIVGEIPLWKNSTGQKVITPNVADVEIVEAFRMLRYNLNFINQGARVFQLTSSTPSHGKTFTSANLAAVIAIAKKRVLLIDADIRRRTLSENFHHNKGLTGWLIDTEGTLSLEDIIVHDRIAEGVDFLPAGMVPPNPAELLMSDRLDLLIEKAREAYDFIIIDGTPMFTIADSDIVARVADASIFVMRIGYQDKNILPQLERLHKEGRMKSMCILLNGVPKESAQYGYGFGYGYGYGYEKRAESQSKSLGGKLLGKLKK